MLFVRSELSYDKHHEDADRIYRIAFNGYPPSGGGDEFAASAAPVGEVLREEFPAVESVVRFYPRSPSVSVDAELYADESVWAAEPHLFDVFTIPLVEGNPEGLLVEPATAVISASVANRFFGQTSAIGKSIVFDDTLNVTVTAVMEDFPSTSHWDADVLVSWSTYEDQIPSEWLNIGFFTYVKLGAEADPDQFAASILNMVNERNAEQMQAVGFRAELIPEKLTDIYLTSKRGGQLGDLGDITQIWIFSAVALFIVLLAIINFTNLAVARSMDRAREVGVRKVVGSSKSSLVFQFLGESASMAVFALVVGAGLFALGLPLLNNISGKEFSLFQHVGGADVLFILGIAVVTGILGGLYPALVMSGFRSVDVLKGSFHSSKSGARLRKGLVAFQFAISIALIAGTGIVSRQLNYMQSVDLGFDQERMLVLEMSSLPGDALAIGGEAIKEAFSVPSQVVGASVSGMIPGRGMGRILFGADGIADDDIRSANFLSVGFDYFDNLGIVMVAGRALSVEFPSDVQEAIVISESTVEYLGWGTPEDAIGKNIITGGRPRIVVGVAADYHHASLKEAIEPMLFVSFPQGIGYLSLRLAAGTIREGRAAVEDIWEEIFPGQPMQAFFLDEDYNRQYDAEERLGNIFSIFSILAIIIASLGLIGLAAFTAQQRTKEIGVRKVLGASVTGVTTLLSREFVLLVLVGFVIAVPTTWYGMNVWLETFPYQSGTGYVSYLLAGLGALIIAVASVSIQSIRAAAADPVKSLRYE